MATAVAGDYRANGQSAAGSWPWLAKPPSLAQDRRLGWQLWALCLAVVCLMVAFGPKRSVMPAYLTGAEHWVAGLPLYNPQGIGFIYLPQAAVLFVPLAAMHALLAELLWRLLSVGLYAWGVRRFSALAEERARRPVFALVTLIAVPLAFASAKSGQATLPMAGLMMSAVAYLAGRSWWRAAVCLALAISIKPLAMVLILLSAAVYRPMIGRLLIMLGVMLAVPFLTQQAAYVQSQYLAFGQSIQSATDHCQVECFAELFGLLGVAGFDVTAPIQMAWRAAFALLTLLTCLWYSRRMDTTVWGIFFYALSTCYLMLFNPRTENNTYSMLAPAIGVFFAWALVSGRSGRMATLALIVLGTLGTFEIGRLITSEPHSIWLAPLMCVLFSGCVIADLVGERPAERPAVDLPAGGHA